MILNWMLASALFALVLAGAAMLGGRAGTAVGKPRRLPWAFAIAAATLWPLLAGLWAVLVPQAAVTRITTRISSDASQTLAVQLPIGASTGEMIDQALVFAWIALSLALSARIVLAMLRMRAVTRAAQSAMLDGTQVLVSESAGPAVSGFWNPRIVVPRWLLELDAPLRSLVLRHEREHVANGDGGVMLGAALATTVMPWNPVVWWMARRLRLAVELDCDARVLAARENLELYGRLLMLVAQRQAHARLAPMLAESNTDLEWRIGTMNEPTTKHSRARAVALSAVAIGLAVFAFTSPAMAGVRTPRAVVPVAVASPAERSLPAIATRTQAQQGPAKLPPPKPTGQEQKAPPAPAKTEQKVTTKPAAEVMELAVSNSVEEAPNTQRPRYPDILRSAGVEGVVIVQFVVNEDGSADTSSLKVLRSTHELFKAAVRYAMPNMRFTPAMVKGRAVRQLIEQTFEFNVVGSTLARESLRTDSVSASRAHVVNNVVITVPRPPE